jgi:hypothetical protein
MTFPHGVGERVYRSLLRLYPADFRDRFAEEMVQLFHDKLRDARAGRAPGGSAGAWLTMLGDVAITAVSERTRRNRTMAHSLASAPPIPVRLLGALGIVGGVAILAAFLLEIPPDLNALRIIVVNLGAIAVILAVHRRQARVSPVLALAGAVPAVLANAWYLVMVVLSLGGTGGFGLVFFWAGVALWISVAWFGLVTFRLGTVTRWGSLAVAIGAALTLTGIDRLGLTSTIFGQLSQVGIVTMAIGWILLGADVATRGMATARSADELS